MEARPPEVDAAQYLREKLDPYADEKHGTQVAWLYAWLYGHPGFDRVTGVNGDFLSLFDVIVYISFAGFVDYLVIWSLVSVWPLSAVTTWAFGPSLGQHPIAVLLLLSFLFRARLSGLVEYMSRRDTHWTQAAGAVLEVCPAAYWHILLGLLARLPLRIGLMTMIRLLVSFLSDGNSTYDAFDAVLEGSPVRPNRTLREMLYDSAKTGLITAAGPILPFLLVGAIAVLMGAAFSAASFVLGVRRRYWGKATRFLEHIRDAVEEGYDRAAHSFTRWTEGPFFKALGLASFAAARVLGILLAMHALPWKSGGPRPVDGDEVLAVYLRYVAEVAARFRRSRHFTFNAIHNFRDETKVYYWPPSQVVSLANLSLASGSISSQLTHAWGTLRRRHTPTDQRPYSQLAEKQIRVLRLYPAQLRDQDLEAELVVRNLGEPAPYVAISYRWSDQWSGNRTKAEPVVVVNGYRLAVGPGTYEALRAVRSPYRTTTVWIDAICINQADTAERGQQVQLMAAIYEQARKVLIWLGEPPNARLAVRKLRAVWSRLRLLDAFDSTLAMRVFQDQAGQPGLRALKDLIRRDWFERAWIAQELTVARSAEMRYGPESLPWSVFASFAFLVWTSPLKQLLSSDFDADPKGGLFARARFGIPWDIAMSLGQLAVPRSLTPVLTTEDWMHSISEAPKRAKGAFGLRHCQLLQRLALLHRTGRRETLDFYLRNLYHGAGEFRSTDPRDKVYAVLSLSAERDAPAFRPDYAAAAADVYTAAAAYFHDRGASLLAECGRGYDYPYRHHTCAWHPGGDACAVCGRLPNRLPSWAPNWSATRFHAPLDLTTHEHDLHQCVAELGPAAAGFQAELGRRAFRAAGHGSFHAEVLAPATGDGRRGLLVSGCRRLAAVTALAAPFAPAYIERKAGDVDAARPPELRWNRHLPGETLAVHGADAWWTFAERHTPDEYGPPVGGRRVTRKAAFCHTLVAGRAERGLGTGGLEARYDGFAAALRAVQVLGEPAHVVFAAPERRARHQAFGGPLITACMGRRLGVAAGGHYLGLFPLGAREGDEVWLVAGVGTPLVLRPCEGDAGAGGEAPYENVGECYVHGIMYGEAWDDTGLETVLLY